MKIGIIDDDVSFSTQLKNKIKTSLYFEDAEIVVFNEKFETLDLMDYEYLFMDIMLLQTSGIELAKKVKNKQTKIIFVSANEALVYDCFDIHLYFFIRKAFYEEDFKRFLLKIEKDEAESNKQYLLDEKIINIFAALIFIIFNLIEMFVHFILKIKNFNNIRL